MQITIADCVAMHMLLKYHKSWNNGADWLVGSPSKGTVKYVIPDHGVTVIRHTMQGLVGPNHVTYLDRFVRMNCRFVRMNWQHDDLLVEAQWRMFDQDVGMFDQDVWEAMVEQHRWEPEFIQLQWVHHVGDPGVFLECLTEFKLWNSLTHDPVTL